MIDRATLHPFGPSSAVHCTWQSMAECLSAMATNACHCCAQLSDGCLRLDLWIRSH